MRYLASCFLLPLTTTYGALATGDSPLGHHHPGPIHGHHTHQRSAESPYEATISLGYDSRYVTEGRDNLDGDPLLHGTLELSFHDFLVGAWYAQSPTNSYDEFNLWLEYGFALGDVEGYVGVNHLRFPDDNEHDNEVGFGLSYGELPWGLVVGVDAYYSFGADGFFAEAALSREFRPCDWLTLEPGIVFGWNEGYVSSGHRGANHLAAAISAIIPLGEIAELSAYLSYNFAVNSSPLQSPDDDLLKDFFYGGAAVSFTF